jgi:hypothetical protein
LPPHELNLFLPRRAVPARRDGGVLDSGLGLGGGECVEDAILVGSAVGGEDAEPDVILVQMSSRAAGAEQQRNHAIGILRPERADGA